MKKVLIILLCGLSLSVAAAPFNAVVPIHDKGAQTFYVEGKLGSLDATEFMLDTGSGYLVINQQSLTQLKENGQAGYVKDIKGILANGDEFVVPVWRIASMTINDQCILRNVEAAVFPGKTRQILGLTALKKAAPFIVSFDPPQIVFSHCTRTES
ncbi:MAG: retroviral-like aspartic protease family protein [Gammaproteobacteria bacterium]|nr:retroviral-like aspartic protease family protein [Gammaproteobacteria bacterium]